MQSFAEQHHLQRMTATDAISAKSCEATFEKLLHQGLSAEELFDHVAKQHVRVPKRDCPKVVQPRLGV